MYKFQKSLPNLPLPALDQTCKLYLDVLAPLLNPTELEATRNQVTDFQNSIGPRLQKQLELVHKATKTSYLYDLGVKNFLENRSPLPIHINFGGVLTPLDKTADASLTQLAATWIHCSLQFYLQIKAGSLSPDQESPKSGGRPLCMTQYENLFGCARVPGINRDSLKPRQNKQNIVVVWQNIFFSLELVDGNQIASIEAIEQQLRAIVAQDYAKEPTVGALTTLNRTGWAILRNSLTAISSVNVDTLQLLDSALFVVCLDDTEPQNLAAAARSALHGNGRNRWFDKPLQFIFTKNGWAGINVEHCGLDGYAVMRCLYEIQQISQQLNQPLDTLNLEKHKSPQQLNWDLTEEIREEIQLATAAIDQLIDKTASVLLRFTEFGRKYIKHHLLSPDATVQLAIQLAYGKRHGKRACTYESVHTRRFRYGRTEAMRSVTPESVELCNLFSTSASNEQKYIALKAAVSAHVARQRACQQGYGADRHLAALQQIARLQNITPAIFKDRAYTEVLGQSVLSTSSLAPGMGIDAFCFGPVVEHGYGIGYIIQPESIVLNVTSRDRQASQFVEALEQALTALGELMTLSDTVP
ncbi:MAG: choline/carnitine O-acyltransferase [Cyanobacteria bacterium P01_A01_bin.123]